MCENSVNMQTYSQCGSYQGQRRVQFQLLVLVRKQSDPLEHDACFHRRAPSVSQVGSPEAQSTGIMILYINERPRTDDEILLRTQTSL